MATTVRVEAALPGRKGAKTAEHPIEIDVGEGPITAGALLEAVVRAEVASFGQRVEARSFLRVLTEQSLANDLARGVVRTDALPTDTMADAGTAEGDPGVDPDEAVAVAVEAFGDGQFAFVVDDDKIDDLDTQIEFRAGTRLLFLRLVPLTGGC